MRVLLDNLYKLSGLLGAFFLTLILVVVLSQVGLNLGDKVAKWTTGSPMGLLIPSYAQFAGFFLAAGTFFALAYTFRHGAHIRVNLLLVQMPSGIRRVAEIWSSAVAFGMTAFISYWMIDLLHDSWRYGDSSQGLFPIKVWIPQLAMVSGSIMLAIATLDSFVQNLLGRQPGYLDAGPESELLETKIEMNHE